MGPAAPARAEPAPAHQAGATGSASPITSASTAAEAAKPAPSASAAAATPPKEPVPEGPRLFAKARFAWIQPEPHASKGWLGYLGLGSSIALRGGSIATAKVPGSEGRSGCRAWYAIEPRGYICDGDAATLDPKDPAVVAVAAAAPQTGSPWPYEYGESIGAPRYKRPPTAAEQRKAEWNLAEHLGLIAKARASADDLDKSLVGLDLAPAADTRWGKGGEPLAWLEASPLVREARPFVANGSTVAYTRQVDIDGRTYLVSHDLALVPKDRVKPYPRSEFHGVEIGTEAELPLAFFRKMDRPKYRRGADGTFEKTGAMWPRLAWVGLTGEEAKEGKRTFLATREPDIWVAADEAAVVRRSEPPAIIKRASTGRRTWLDISVLGGTLVAYENDKPVFATLISPGRGGIPEAGKDPLDTASTPTGTFRVDGKFVTATMVSSTNDLLVHTEVQYVQNFHGPHALHAAYWHDVWGEKKSGGCVNLAPIDAKRLFEWGEPPVPKDWYGLRSLPEFGPATVVVVHK
ncbi:Hypothetical protein A7982_12757 [Minicystis rosea]|nr:Hypothetical protein A7982_12757 [Minicystis rosea]